MDREERRERKARLSAVMLDGGKWREAAERAGIRISRTAAYRLLRLVRTDGDAVLEERRHGHPHKLTPSVREWLIECCRGLPIYRDGSCATRSRSDSGSPRASPTSTE